jgi:hypothetical protein
MSHLKKTLKIISGRKLMPISVIAVCPETGSKHVNTLYGQKVEFLDVKSRVSKSNHSALKDELTEFQSVPVCLPLLSR